MKNEITTVLLSLHPSCLTPSLTVGLLTVCVEEEDEL